MSKRLLQIAIAAVLSTSLASSSAAQVFNAPIPQSNPAVQPAVGPAPSTGAVEQTGWGIPMPKITMPKVTMPKLTMPNMDSVTAPIKSGFGKVSAGSKKAWEGAKEMLTFGDKGANKETVNRATAPKQPSLWQKLTTRKTEPQVPQTVGEFMSQPRLDP
ncbi:MAG: hypothetical protein AAGD11_04960 [Planctomycetota bacterium]